MRPDVVRRAAAEVCAFSAVFAADPDDYAPGPPRLAIERLSMCSTLFDPAIVWRFPHHPFLEDGDPSRHMQADLARAGHRLLEFPFCDDACVLHLGRSTLAQVARRNATDNRYHAWAEQDHERHFALRPDGAGLRVISNDDFELRYPTIVSTSSLMLCKARDDGNDDGRAYTLTRYAPTSYEARPDDQPPAG
jgi:hypothetical protein